MSREEDKEGGITKIDSHWVKKYSPLKERAYRKYKLDIDRSTAFLEPTLELDNEQTKLFDDFVSYCYMIQKCIYCLKPISLQNFKSNDDNEIVAQCDNCPNNLVDSSTAAKEYVVWANQLFANYGMSFKNGFPKRIRHERAVKFCKDCGKPHTKMEYFNLK